MVFKVKVSDPKILLVDFHGTVAPSMEALSEVFADEIIKAHPQASRVALIKHYMKTRGIPIEEQARLALNLVDGREHSREEGLSLGHSIWTKFVTLKIKPFKEIPQELGRLRKAGWKLFLSTDNPQWVADRLVDTVGLRNSFDGVLGSDVEASHAEHKVVRHVRQLAERFGIKHEDYGKHFVYFGDSTGEMENAKKIGIIGVGRTTTYPARKMRKAGAKRIVPGTGLRAKLHLRVYLRK
jgi:phosphoglycolate phosphatase-like HAD superfamily hydrolase